MNTKAKAKGALVEELDDDQPLTVPEFGGEKPAVIVYIYRSGDVITDINDLTVSGSSIRKATKRIWRSIKVARLRASDRSTPPLVVISKDDLRREAEQKEKEEKEAKENSTLSFDNANSTLNFDNAKQLSEVLIGKEVDKKSGYVK